MFEYLDMSPNVKEWSRLSAPTQSIARLSGVFAAILSTTSKAKLNLSSFLKEMPFTTPLSSNESDTKSSATVLSVISSGATAFSGSTAF